MRYWVLVSLVAACGGATQRSTEVPDDLELEPALSRRVLGAATGATRNPDILVEVVSASSLPIVGPQMNLGIRDADVTEVLHQIASVADFGLVVSDDVHARLTLDMRNVTWRQAIHVIAHLQGLEVSEEDGIVLVTR